MLTPLTFNLTIRSSNFPLCARLRGPAFRRPLGGCVPKVPDTDPGQGGPLRPDLDQLDAHLRGCDGRERRGLERLLCTWFGIVHWERNQLCCNHASV